VQKHFGNTWRKNPNFDMEYLQLKKLGMVKVWRGRKGLKEPPKF
jgi:hypothetical protein